MSLRISDQSGKASILIMLMGIVGSGVFLNQAKQSLFSSQNEAKLSSLKHIGGQLNLSALAIAKGALAGSTAPLKIQNNKFISSDAVTHPVKNGALSVKTNNALPSSKNLDSVFTSGNLPNTGNNMIPAETTVQPLSMGSSGGNNFVMWKSSWNSIPRASSGVIVKNRARLPIILASAAVPPTLQLGHQDHLALAPSCWNRKRMWWTAEPWKQLSI